MSKIQAAVLGVMKDIATTGIAKLQRNVQQGYTFRGIESAMNELSPLLVKEIFQIIRRLNRLQKTMEEKK